ncbi:branched-chain alpha-ketoacid dehydrogenase [Sporodiniella umbellata]|nr:branched-chain alpha-ketoacid dehydrogenase [Sporodiniella umbellata]
MNPRLLQSRRLFHYTIKTPNHAFYQNKIIEDYASQSVNPSTLRQFIFFGRQMNMDRLVTSANWVRNELLIRLAHRIRGFQQLPFIVGTHPEVDHVYSLYYDTFQQFRNFPPVKTKADNSRFCELLKSLLSDNWNMLPTLARGLSESAVLYPPDQHDLDLFLNRILRSRISRRILAEQHLALTKACENRDSMTLVENWRNTDVKLPEIKVSLNNLEGEIKFAYVPEQLESIMYELLENAVNYTLLNTNPSPIQVTVSANESDIYFRISDQGGGITDDKFERLWSYQARARMSEFKPKNGNQHLGLMMSRIYAEYWGGELQVMTMDGHGTDVYVRIPRLGTQIENLGIEAAHAFHDSLAEPVEKIKSDLEFGIKAQAAHQEWVDTSLTHKAFAGSSWCESCIIQS